MDDQGLKKNAFLADSKSKKGKKKEGSQDLKKRIKELEDQLARAVADYKNLERRVEIDKKEIMKYANKELLSNLLPAFDTLFLAGKHVEDEGVKLTIQRILDTLKDSGIEKIDTENSEYNPEIMECVEVADGQENEILEELQPGFMLNGKLLRPARVRVGGNVERKVAN